MSQENVELQYRVIDAFNRRDLDAVLALMDADVEAVSRLVVVESSYIGHEGIRRWWQDLFSVFPDFRVEVVVPWPSTRVPAQRPEKQRNLATI